MKQLGATTTSGSTMATSSGTMATEPSSVTGNILDLDTSSVTNGNSYSEQVLLYVCNVLFHLMPIIIISNSPVCLKDCQYPIATVLLLLQLLIIAPT